MRKAHGWLALLVIVMKLLRELIAFLRELSQLV